MSNSHVFEGFSDELEKLAIDKQVLLGNVGALGGAGAALGAVGGALHGGVKRYREARARGEGVGQGFLEGAGGALQGAGRGALVGAGAGALAGAATPKALYDRLSQSPSIAGAGARFGQRQMHAFTGWLPTAGDASSIERARGGAYRAREAVGKAQESLGKVWGGEDPSKLRSAVRGVERAQAGLRGAERAQGMGLTSIPGYAKSLRDKPLETLRAGMSEQWHSGGLGAKALTIGLPALGAVQTLRSPEPTTGPGKGERLGRELATAAGGVLTAPLPFVPGQLVSQGLGRVGGGVGRVVDRLRGRRGDGMQLAQRPENTQGQHVPTERVTSPTALGQSGVEVAA
jgi:hypothetical protein